MTKKEYVDRLMKLALDWSNDKNLCNCLCQNCPTNNKIKLITGGEITICELFLSILNNKSILGMEE